MQQNLVLKYQKLRRDKRDKFKQEISYWIYILL